MFYKTPEGVSLHYRAHNLASGKPVFAFINAVGTDMRIWDKVVDRLGDQFGLVLHDLRGHGLSGDAVPAASITDHANDLAALLDHLCVDKSIICGISAGGVVAQGLYAERPDLVCGLMLCGTANKVGTPDMWNARIEAVSAGGVEAIVDGVIDKWFTTAYRAENDAEMAGIRKMLTQTSTKGYCGTCAALRDADFTESDRNITVPTLCIAGGADPISPEAVVQGLADIVPGAALHVVDDAGHLPCMDHPDAFTALLSDLAGHCS